MAINHVIRLAAAFRLQRFAAYLLLAVIVAISRTSVSDLLADIRGAKAARIGIDGIDGSGKSTLARQIAAALSTPLLSVDDFLKKNQGGYVPFVDIERLSAATVGDRFIIEGVCLLEVLELVNIDLDFSIYVQRIHLELWADEDWLGLDEDLESFLEKQRYVTARFSGVPESEGDLGLDEEVIRYHHKHRPHEAANVLFAREDS